MLDGLASYSRGRMARHGCGAVIVILNASLWLQALIRRLADRALQTSANPAPTMMILLDILYGTDG